MDNYVSKEWELILDQNGLRGFSDFWNLPGNWVEPCNHRRGGWSGVSRVELNNVPRTGRAMFVKRQENYCTRTWSHPLVGVPTLKREFENLIAFQKAGLPVPTPVFFGSRKVGRKFQAVLALEELKGFKPLSAILKEWRGAPPALKMRRPLIHAVANVVRTMHAIDFQHNALYPKHVWVKTEPTGKIETRLIDLEKARRFVFTHLAQRKDLGTLNREAFKWRARDRVEFLKAYLGPQNHKQWRHLWRILEVRLKTRHPETLNG